MNQHGASTFGGATAPVLGTFMHYLQAGEGRPVLMLHGNPTSSHLWRHVLARVGDSDTGHRWIAPDLIGMGGSGKPELSYRLVDHIAYVDAFIDALDLREFVLVGHDWGVAIAMDQLRRRPERVRGIAMMEGHLRPLTGWDVFDEGGRDLFQRLRTPDLGERMVLRENFFVDTLLPAAMPGALEVADLDVYRAPYPDAESRRPLLQWAREIPVAGQPADVAQVMADGARHLSGSRTPKLLVHGDPGVLVTNATVEWCRQEMTNLDVVDVGGPAGHFLPEDRAEEVATALIDWVSQLE